MLHNETQNKQAFISVPDHSRRILFLSQTIFGLGDALSLVLCSIQCTAERLKSI